MTGILFCLWHIEPLCPPEPWHPCAHCGTPRAFRPTGKVRLNANGRRLDAWLIYSCTRCEATWNLPLLDRAPISSVAPQDLWSMTHSDPAWVCSRIFDLTLLRRHATRVDQPPGLRLHSARPLPSDWSALQITLSLRFPTNQRLDRLLARTLGLSRSAVIALVRKGALTVSADLNRPIRDGTRIQLAADALTAAQRLTLAGACAADQSGFALSP